MTDPRPTTEPRRSAGSSRRLILLRHGKSDYPSGLRDYDRPLADRGESEAGVAGRWVRQSQPRIDAVLCSGALRARQTFAATGIVAPVIYSDALYEATPAAVLTEIQGTDPAVTTLLVVGHSPGMPALATSLADTHSDPEALSELTAKFPTAAMAVLEVASDWSELGPETARLVEYHVARVKHNHT